MSGATDLLAKGAESLINKKSTTASDALRNDKRERTGAVVGGLSGAGKGFDIGTRLSRSWWCLVVLLVLLGVLLVAKKKEKERLCCSRS